MINKKTNILLWCITILIVCFFTLPRLIQHGCFMDGELYAAIAHNMANGIGNFWKPSFSTTLHETFITQPPLKFIILSLFFTFFGNSMYVERGYDFFICILNVYVIHLIWKEVFISSSLKKLSWLPALFWIIIPVCSWTVVNNMLELTMSFFVQCSILFGYKALSRKDKTDTIFLGCFIVLALITKGFTGIFPLSIFIIGILFFEKHSFKKMLENYLILLILFILITCVALSFTTIRNFGINYFNNQVIYSLMNEKNVETRWFILERLVSELLPVLIFIGLILGIGVIKRRQLIFNKKNAGFFFLVGLSGVIPIMISTKQSGYYMFCALPSFAIGFAIIIAKTINDWIVKIEMQLLKYFKMIMLVGVTVLFSVLFFSQNKFIRNENSLSDIYQFGEIIPQHSTIGVSPDLFQDWGTGCYFQRFYFIAVDGYTNDWNKHKYVMINKSSTDNYIQFLSNYTKLNIKTQLFDLYQHK